MNHRLDFFSTKRRDNGRPKRYLPFNGIQAYAIAETFGAFHAMSK
jgi:hypothetical protein